MKVRKYARHPFNDTQRKRSFVAIKQRREREKLPLFAEEIAEGQSHVDAIMRERAETWARSQAAKRTKRAQDWINTRRMLKLLPDQERVAFIAYYERSRFPIDPGYLRAVLHMFLDGRLVMYEGQVESQAHLDFLADRAVKIRTMPEDELLRRMQSPYCSGTYLADLRAEHARRQRAG